MQKPDDIPEDVWETASECVGVGGGYELRGVLHTQRTDIARAILAERERCAQKAFRVAQHVNATASDVVDAIRGGTHD